ncbi:MAG: FliG C-terminal domain-containing protein [Desulfovibrionaceae bacterium]
MLPFTGGARLEAAFKELAEEVRSVKDDLEALRRLLLERDQPQAQLETQWRRLEKILSSMEPEQLAATLLTGRERLQRSEYACWLLAVLRVLPAASCPDLVDGLGSGFQDDLPVVAGVRQIPLDSLQSLNEELFLAVSAQSWAPQRSRAAAVAGPLACLNPGARAGVLDNLKDRGEEAAALRRVLLRGFLTFEDLRRADDAGLSALAHEASASDLSLALSTASRQLRERMLGALPERPARLLAEAVEETRARDQEVRAAQLRLLLKAQRMLEEGRLAFVEDLARS